MKSKIFKTLDEQIQILRSKGLVVNDEKRLGIFYLEKIISL